MNSSYTRVFIDDMPVPVRVGYRSWEKHVDRPTLLRVSVEMQAARTRWATDDGAYRLEDLIDYSRVSAFLNGWSTRPHTESLEQLADELLDFCFADGQVGACRVRLVKPDIIPNAAGAGIEIFRTREDHKTGKAPVVKP